MRGVNKWIGIGNATADPEVRYAANGSAVANVTVACGGSYKNKTTGENVDQTEFVRVVLFGKLGEIAGEYLKKGSQVYIEGRLQTRKWEKDGIDRFVTEVVASEMQMLGSRDTANQKRSPGPIQDITSRIAANLPAQDDFDGLDVPF